MGGMGSGPYGLRGTKQRKQTVEETYRLDIQSLKGHFNGETLTMSWNRGKQSIGIYTKKDHIILAYSSGEKSIREYVGIESTNVNFGKRLWFVCPGCRKRTGCLYIVGKLFRCRNCHGLTYTTCQESGDPLDYLALKIRRQQRKLGLKRPKIDELPSFKPKHMHWETFARERERLELMQMARMEAWLKRCRRG